MSEPNAYQKAIFRAVDEKNTRDLVNPFRFGSTSPKSYKRWSPEISEKERSRKKKEREEAYIKSLKESDKPYFLVKNKEVFTNPSDVKEMSDTLQGKYYKIVKGTEPVGDIHSDAQRALQGVRKQTVVHGEAPTDPFDIASIYKIEGIEYLPEGFLELEPLLYYDEYFFDDQFDEKRFLEEQRRLKAIRRKQYAQRDVGKKREVTIFVVDQYKDRLAEYLELWYAKNQRRLRDEEIEYIAKELETDFATIAELQEVFLKKKKFENAARLSNYLNAPETREERVSSLPQELQKHFSQLFPKGSLSKKSTTSPNGKASRVSEAGGRKSSTNNRPAEPIVIEDTEEQKEQKEAYQLELDSVLAKIKRTSQNLVRSGSGIETYDSKSNGPRGSSKSPRVSRRPVSPSGTKPRATQSVEEAMQSIINRSLGASNSSRDAKSQSKVHSGSAIKKSNLDAKVTFVEVDDNGRPLGNSQGIEIIQKSSQAVAERNSLSPAVGERRAKSTMYANDPYFNNSNIFTVKSKTVVGLDPSQLKVTRSTIAYKTTGGKTVVEQKLSPTIIGNDYYYQTIRDVIDQQGRHNVSVVTTRADGTVIDNKAVDADNLGNFHHSVLIDHPNKSTSRSLIIRNEFGETLSVTKVPLTTPHSSVKSTHAIIGPDGERKSTVRVLNYKNSSMVAHTLKPMLVGDEYYQQLVIHTIGQLGKPAIVVTTTDESGKEVFSSQVPPELAGESYITEVIVEPQEDGAIKKSILTLNERGQTVAASELVLPANELHEGLNAPVVVEVFDNSNGRQTCTISQVSAHNPSKVTKRTLIKTSQLGNSYYIEVEKDEVKPDGSRQVTLVAKDTRGISVARKTHAPTVMGLIGEDYFADLENEVEQVIQQTDEKIMVAPAGENLVIRIIEDSVSDNGKRVLVASVVDGSGQSIVKQTYRPTINEVLGEHYFDDLINKAESVMRDQKVTEVKKQSLVPQKISTFNNASRHTFGSSSDGHAAEGKNMFFVALLENGDLQRQTIVENSSPHFSVGNKPKSQSAMAGVGEGLRLSQFNQGSGSHQSVHEVVRNNASNTQVTFADNVQAYPRSNTAIGEGQFQDAGRVAGPDSQRGKSPQNPLANASGFLKTISSINPHENSIESNNAILAKSREMKAHLENYIETITQINESQIADSQRLQSHSPHTHVTNVTVHLDDNALRAKVFEVFNQEKEKLSDQIVQRLREFPVKGSVDGRKESDVMEEFYEFCRNKLPNDDMYKESVLFVSLFYYFLEKKNLIK